MSDGSMDGALRAAFGAPGESVVARLQRAAGVKSRILLHDAPDEESPLLRVGGAPGAEDGSRYRIVGEIAKGGVGVVYKARDVDLGRDVALKVLRREHASNPEVLERLVEEAQIGGQLQHPGIVPVYGLGLQPDGRPYFAMKLIKGRTLAAVLKDRRDPLRDLPRFLRVFEQICQTVAYAHTRGVIHRDLKPSNVMVGGFGEVLVVDWGFGKVLGRNDPMAEKLVERTIVATVRSKGEGSESITGSVMGTPAYMPPEQALGQIETLDERCDVFALGAILCEILTGEPPYVGAPEDLLTMAAQARLEGAHERLSSCRADPALVELCRRALSPMRADRPENASALAGALEEFLSTAERRAHDAELRAVRERAQLELERQGAVWARRAKRRTMALAAATVLAVLLAGGAWSWRDGRRRGHAAEIRPQAERALGEATRLLGAEKWTGAAAEARRAADIAAQSDLLATLRADAHRLAARAEAEDGRISRRDRLVAALEESRMRRADDFDSVATDDAYLAAFSAAGVDFARASTAEMAEAVRREYPEAIESIAPALDEWAWLRRTKPELNDRDWKLPDALARAIDPDPRRNDFRDAAASKDVVRLRAAADDALVTGLPVRALDMLAVGIAEAGDSPAAVSFLLKLCDRHPSDFWIHYHAALYSSRAYRENRTSAASSVSREDWTACATAAVALRPRSPVAQQTLGIALLSNGDARGAITAYREAIRIKPDLPGVQLRLSDALLADGDVEGGISALREAIRIGPDCAEAHNRLGAALRGSGDLAGAIAEFRAAIRIKPDVAEAYFNLGLGLYETKDFDGAIAAYRERIRLRPGDAEAYNNLSAALSAAGDQDGAAEACRATIRIQPGHARAYGNLGNALLMKKDLEGAIAAYRQAISLDPDAAVTHFNLGLALDRAQDVDGAIAAYRNAVRLQPDFPAALCNLGRMLRFRGRFAESLDCYRKGHELGSRRADWRNPSAGWVEQAERLVDLDGRLPAVLAGTSEPRDPAERCAFAELCWWKALPAEATGLYLRAFADEPALAEDVAEGHRWMAACAAVLAAEKDASQAVGLRGLALGWLRAELAAYEARLRATPTAIEDALRHIRGDRALHAVRERIDDLPAPEREEWREFWADVDALIARAKEAQR